MTEIRPFRVEISDAVIDDRRERLARTRWCVATASTAARAAASRPTPARQNST